MKKNVKLGLMAGLLITPAIVAQAGEVQASETQLSSAVAASTAVEVLIGQVKELNESATVTNINSAETQYKKLIGADANAIDTNTKALIVKKLDYLKAFKSLDITGVVTAITALKTSTKLLAEVPKINSQYDALLAKLTATVKELDLDSVTDPDGILTNLTYVDGEQGEAKFVTDYIKPANTTILNNAKALIPEIEELIKFVAPLLTASNDPQFDREKYKTDVADAVAKLKDTKNISVTSQLIDVGGNKSKAIKTYIEDVNKGISTALKLESDINDFIKNLLKTSEKTFVDKITTFEAEYKALGDLQKLVGNADNLTELVTVKPIVAAIKDLEKKPLNTDAYRSKVEAAKTAYKGLDVTLELLVINAEKLENIELIITKVKEVETKVGQLTAENLTTVIPQAVVLYDQLSTVEKTYLIEATSKNVVEWKASSTSATNVVKQIDTVSTEAFNQLATLTDTKKFTTTTAFISKVSPVYIAYSKLGDVNSSELTTAQLLVTNRARIETLKSLVDITKPLTDLNVKNATFIADLDKAKINLGTWSTNIGTVQTNGLVGNDETNLGELKIYLDSYVQNLENEKLAAKAVIDAIKKLKDNVNLIELVTVRTKFNALSKDAQALVNNLSDLTALETQYKSAISVVDQIENLDVSASDFAKKVLSNKAAYDKLTPALKQSVSNYAVLESLIPIVTVMEQIDTIRSAATDFPTKLDAAQTEYNKIIAGITTPPAGTPPDILAESKQRLLTEYGPKLVAFKKIISNAKSIDDAITTLGAKNGEEFILGLAKVLTDYKALDSITRKLVTLANKLTELEKSYKTSLKVINLIEELPTNTDKSYAKKVVAAEKAYQKLNEKQKIDVYIYNDKLKPVLIPANLIDRISKLKVGSKNYEADVAAIEKEYNALDTKAKAIVYNFSVIAQAQENVRVAGEVIALINEAIPTAESYIAKLIVAREAYAALTKDLQKLVMNYKDLTTRERAVKPILNLDIDISSLDPSNVRIFLSKYKSAIKAYEKLTLAERKLLTNAKQFKGELKTIHDVLFAINAIKPSSQTFVVDTKAARTLYVALSAEQKAKISNLSVLEGHELNVLGGSRVDEMIRELSNVAPTEFIAKVKEVREAYKALSSANKKAVTLENELKAQEKYIKAVETAIEAIDGLSNPRNNLSKQFAKVNTALQKLDAKQLTYVTNIDRYSNLSNVIHVYDLIERLKSNDRYYMGNLEAAKLAYDRLSTEDKLKVTNYYKLQEGQLDIIEVQQVMNIIASLSRNSSTFVTDVENALEAYKLLPSGSKKQVANYSELQQAEKDIKTVQKVVQQISAIDPTLRTYESKARTALKAYEKLTADQKKLVSNYSVLQNAIFELNI